MALAWPEVWQSQSPLRPSQARTALDGGAILVVVEHIGDQDFNIYKLSKKKHKNKKKHT